MTRIILIAGVLLSTILLAAISFDNAYAAGYVRFGGIYGESVDADHQGWSDLASFTLHITTQQKDNGDLKGKPIVDALITKRVDGASPVLLTNSCQGKKCTPIGVMIDICRTVTDNSGSETQQCYLRYELEKATIRSYSNSFKIEIDGYSIESSRTTNTVPLETNSYEQVISTETISLNFEKIKIIYTPFDSDGNPGTPIIGFYER